MNFSIVAKLSASTLILAMCAGCTDWVEARQIVLIDPVTGCQYLGNKSSTWVPAGLRAIIDASGKPVCKAAQ